MGFSKTQKRILFYSFVFFGVTELLESIYNVTDYSIGTNLNLIFISMLNAVNSLSLFIALTGMLIFGIRLIREKGINLISVTIPTLGLLFSLIIIFSSAYTYRLLVKINDSSQFITQNDNQLKIMKDSLKSKDVSLGIRAAISYQYARMKFEQEGLIIDYFNPDENIETYKPTAEEVAEHEELLKSEVQAKLWNYFGKRSALNSSIFWTLLTVCNILFGFFSPITEKRMRSSKS